jgi:hypothetical protein
MAENAAVKRGFGWHQNLMLEIQQDKPFCLTSSLS